MELSILHHALFFSLLSLPPHSLLFSFLRTMAKQYGVELSRLILGNYARVGEKVEIKCNSQCIAVGTIQQDEEGRYTIQEERKTHASLSVFASRKLQLAHVKRETNKPACHYAYIRGQSVVVWRAMDVLREKCLTCRETTSLRLTPFKYLFQCGDCQAYRRVAAACITEPTCMLCGLETENINRARQCTQKHLCCSFCVSLWPNKQACQLCLSPILLEKDASIQMVQQVKMLSIVGLEMAPIPPRSIVYMCEDSTTDTSTPVYVPRWKLGGVSSRG